jgi:hypothetical protein
MRIDRNLVGEPPNAHFWFLKDLPDGKYVSDLTLYYGSMYWLLTAACVRFILNFLHANPGYLALHQNVFAPDEIVFHTLVKHSPFVGAITYIDRAGRRPRTNLTLDDRDFADLLASDALFARKFHETHSRRLLDLIDAHIHRKQATHDRVGHDQRDSGNSPARAAVKAAVTTVGDR